MQMKIAFLVGEFPSLSETFVLNQITGLIERGHEVDIYATVPSSQAKVHPDVEKYNLLSYTHYYPEIPGNYFQRLLKGFGLLLTNFLRFPKVLLRSLNLFKYGRKVTSLRLLYATTPFLPKRPQYDIIQCHFGNNGLKGMELRDIGAIQGKLCTTFHGLDISGHLKKYGDRLYDTLFEEGDFFLAVSENWRDRLIKLGCDEKKIAVHRMGIDCRKFKFRPRQPNDEPNIRLVTVARLVEKKGVEYGIRAVSKLSESYPNLKYNIVGDGDLRDSLEQLVQELEASNSVNILGWKQGDEVKSLLDEADILLAPSVTSKTGDQEGIPVVLIEAMATGLPVVSTQHSGIPELIENTVSGFLVPERSVDDLVDMIVYLIKHSETWAEIGCKGRSKVESSYNIDKLNDQLVGTYQQILTAVKQK